MAYTKEQLNGAPTFAYYKGGKAETTGSRVNESTSTPMAPKTDSMKK